MTVIYTRTKKPKDNHKNKTYIDNQLKSSFAVLER